MSNNLIIFKEGEQPVAKRELTELAKTLATSRRMNRIQTNTNGTFRRIVNGEQVGKAVRGDFNAIIVHMLPEVSRTYYEADYDPEAKPTLPDCWSNAGVRPEPGVPNQQAAACPTCPQNVDGSGPNGKGRACRFNRRIALLLDGDPSGNVYQFNIPAKSLFGKGNGNVHPFESYYKYLLAGGESIDNVVTNIAYNLDADTMELQFTPMRLITDEELELVQAAQADPATRLLCELTVAAADGVTAKPEKPLTLGKTETPDEVPFEGEKLPVKQVSGNKFDADEGEEVQEPTPQPEAPKRRGRPPKVKEETPVKADLAAVLKKWDEDDD